MKHLICCLTKSFLGWKFLHCWKISLRQISKSNQVYVHTDSTFNTECCQSTDFRIWWTVKVGSAQRPNVLQYTFNGIYNNIAGKTFITAFIFIKPKYFCRSVFNDSLILCTKDNVLHFHLTSDQTFNSWPKCIWYIFRFKCIFYSFLISIKTNVFFDKRNQHFYTKKCKKCFSQNWLKSSFKWNWTWFCLKFCWTYRFGFINFRGVSLIYLCQTIIKFWIH